MSTAQNTPIQLALGCWHSQQRSHRDNWFLEIKVSFLTRRGSCQYEGIAPYLCCVWQKGGFQLSELLVPLLWNTNWSRETGRRVLQTYVQKPESKDEKRCSKMGEMGGSVGREVIQTMFPKRKKTSGQRQSWRADCWGR